MYTQSNEYIWNGEKILVIIDFGDIISNDRQQQTIDFTYKSIHVRFYYLHESKQAFLVFDRICKNIDDYGEDWNEHFYFQNKNFYQDGEVVNVL